MMDLLALRKEAAKDLRVRALGLRPIDTDPTVRSPQVGTIEGVVLMCKSLKASPSWPSYVPPPLFLVPFEVIP